MSIMQKSKRKSSAAAPAIAVGVSPMGGDAKAGKEATLWPDISSTS